MRLLLFQAGKLTKMAMKKVMIKDINPAIEYWRARLTISEILPPRTGDKPLQKLIFSDEEVLNLLSLQCNITMNINI